MGGSSKPKQQVAEYYLGIHVGLCVDQVDAITGLFYGEKLMWEGELVGPGRIDIDKPDLFGGVKKEGGCRGSVMVLPGPPNQVIPPELSSRVGREPFEMPAYRGMTSLFFSAFHEWDGTYPEPPPEPPIDIPAEGMYVDTSGLAPGQVVGFTLRTDAVVTGWPDGVTLEQTEPATGNASMTFNGEFLGGAPGASTFTDYTEYSSQDGFSNFQSFYDPLVTLSSAGESGSIPPGGIETQYSYNPQTGEMKAYQDGVEVASETTTVAGPLSVSVSRTGQNSSGMLIMSGKTEGIPGDVVSLADLPRSPAR